MPILGELVTYRSINFSFILHLATKDILYTIQKLLGSVGNVKNYGEFAKLNINKKEDLDKLLEFMYDST